MVIISYKKTHEIDFKNVLLNTDSLIIQKHPEKKVPHYWTRNYMHILENDNSIVSYCEQPFKINYFYKKSIREFIPDFYVKYENDREKLIILNKHLIDDQELQEIEKLLQTNKINYQILREHEINTNLLYNYMFLSTYHNKGKFINDVDIHMICETVNKFKRLTIKQLLEELGKTFERKAEILYVTWYLVYGKLLNFNREEKLSLNTIIWS
ncbi:hypothetical protein SAMN05443633_11419 [Chryseobacterium arachidis]|uniref:TnsA endonuclease N terminal n=2 Tax=Chryseobacterium arachidis TaxID=1416778 RepID=A0A1M5J7J6_9FLAO|nr:hypothetical protein [Chryseobacterium arachidis]SHG35993.1 hypothetical protein SAMN05443633_11419 [Chryseobacterium arachidis]